MGIAAITGNPERHALRVQCLAVEIKETKGGKPFYRLSISDGSAPADIRVWSDQPAFRFCETLQKGACIVMDGTFHRGEYGVESSGWTGTLITDPAEIAAVFAGPTEVREKQERDWENLCFTVNSLEHGSLRTLTLALLNEHEEPIRRAAAARGNHHARRGGLIEHLSLMSRAAVALCGVYGELRMDLLVAGVVFHDCGKMIENQFEREGFEMPFSFKAECYGHIAIGVQIAHCLWKQLPEQAQKEDELLLHALSHLILAHHGCAEYGSPVDPKLPEAAVLHYLDQIDAKLEMMRGGRLKEVAPGVFERTYPLRVNLLKL